MINAATVIVLSDLDLDYVSGGGPDGGAPDGGAADGGAQDKPAPKKEPKGDGGKPTGPKKDPATLEIKGEVHGGEGKGLGWSVGGTLNIPF